MLHYTVEVKNSNFISYYSSSYQYYYCSQKFNIQDSILENILQNHLVYALYRHPYYEPLLHTG